MWTEEYVARLLALNPIADLCDLVDALGGILNRIIDHPADAQYRSLRVLNPRLRARVIDRAGGFEALLLIGFRRDAAGGSMVDEKVTLAERAAGAARLEVWREWLRRQAEGARAMLAARRELRQLLADGGPAAAEDGGEACAVCTLQIRLSSSLSISGAFFHDEPTSAVHSFVEASGKVGGSFELLSPLDGVPVLPDDRLGGDPLTLLEAGLYPQATLVLQLAAAAGQAPAHGDEAAREAGRGARAVQEESWISRQREREWVRRRELAAFRDNREDVWDRRR